MDCFSLQGKDAASKGTKCSKFLPAIAAFCWSLAPLDRCKARIQLHAAWLLWWGSHRGLEAAGWPGLGCEHVLSWGSLYRVTKHGKSLARGCCPAGAPPSHPVAVHALGQVLVGLGMMQGDGWGLPLQWVAGFRLVPPISLFGKKKPRQLGRSHGTLGGGWEGRGALALLRLRGFGFTALPGLQWWQRQQLEQLEGCGVQADKCTSLAGTS